MKLAHLLLTVTLVLLAATAIKPVSAISDLNAVSGSAIDDSQIDGAIGTEWGDASNYKGVAVNPQGTAEIWTKNDGANLYVALTFTADSNNPWVSILFGEPAHMTLNTDGALFGHDEFAPNGYKDISFGGAGFISIDAQQDGKGAVSIDSQNQVTVELKKPLSSGDQAGKDIDWKKDNTYTLTLMWDSNGDGSSGGTASHYAGTLTGKTILINSQPIPEFPTLTFIAVLTGATTTASLLLKRRTTKKTTPT